MKKGKVVSLVLAGALLATTAGAVTYKTFTAIERPDFTIVLDGQVQKLKDGNGNAINPVVINGSTYLPLKATAGLFNKTVGWDADTATISLGEDNSQLYLTSLESRNSTEYSWIIRSASDLRIDGDAGYQDYNTGIGWSIWNSSFSIGLNREMLFSTNSKDTLKFSAWSDVDATVYVHDQDDNVVDRFDISANTINEREISIKGIKEVSFAANAQKTGRENNGTLKILDPIVYNK